MTDRLREGGGLNGLVLSAAVASLLAAAAARADTPDDSKDALETVTVTAQFRSQSVQSTPLAVTAVTGEELEARGQTSIEDLGSYAPNVELSQSSSLYGNAVTAYIRGIGQYSSNFALEPGVGIYIDDVYFGTTFGANFDLTDLDRVEILRGPQGTLAGMNSIGGAVKLYSKEADGANDGFVQASYGNFSTVDLRGSADFTLADGWYARVSGVAHRSDGYLRDLDYGCVNPGQGIAASTPLGGSCQTGTEGGTNRGGLRAQLRYAPTDSPLTVNLSTDYSADTSEPVATKLVYAYNPNERSYVPGDPAGGVPFDSRFITPSHSYTSYASFENGGNFTTVFGTLNQVVPGSFVIPRENSVNSAGVAANVDFKIADHLSLKSITAYRSAGGNYGSDLDGSPLDSASEYYHMSHRQLTEELRLNGEWGKLLEYTVGGFYYDAHDRQSDRIEIPTVLYDFLSNDPVTNQSRSAFAHADFHATSNLEVIAGLRYTSQDKSYTFHRTNLDGSLPSGIPLTENWLIAGLDGLSSTYHGSHVDYRLGVDYQWTEQAMSYAQVSTGFKGGGINPIPYVPDQVKPFGPEKLTTFEVGSKIEALGNKVRVNGALFFNRYNDIQMTLYNCPTSTSTTCSETANAGDGHVKGAEFEVALRPVAGLSITSSLSYLDFEYIRVNPSTGVTLGMVAPFNYKWQGALGVQYNVPLGPIGTLVPRLDWSYRSSFYFNAVNDPYNRIAPLGLLNAKVAYEPNNSPWTFEAAVSNVLDHFYYVAANENIAAYGLSSNVVGPPREWLFTVRRSF